MPTIDEKKGAHNLLKNADKSKIAAFQSGFFGGSKKKASKEDKMAAMKRRMGRQG